MTAIRYAQTLGSPDGQLGSLHEDMSGYDYQPLSDDERKKLLDQLEKEDHTENK